MRQRTGLGEGLHRGRPAVADVGVAVRLLAVRQLLQRLRAAAERGQGDGPAAASLRRSSSSSWWRAA
ncbi:hypothetical protein ACFQ1I_21300 [Kitasatospora arboriphila]